ncbi:hypothetical protein EDB83DRAFT_2555134, partial [Lactarius deliciosus]
MRRGQWRQAACMVNNLKLEVPVEDYHDLAHLKGRRDCEVANALVEVVIEVLVEVRGYGVVLVPKVAQQAAGCDISLRLRAVTCRKADAGELEAQGMRCGVVTESRQLGMECIAESVVSIPNANETVFSHEGDADALRAKLCGQVAHATGKVHRVVDSSPPYDVVIACVMLIPSRRHEGGRGSGGTEPEEEQTETLAFGARIVPTCQCTGVRYPINAHNMLSVLVPARARRIETRKAARIQSTRCVGPTSPSPLRSAGAKATCVDVLIVFLEGDVLVFDQQHRALAGTPEAELQGAP